MSEQLWLRAWCEQVWAEHKYLIMLSSYRHYRQVAIRFQEQMRQTDSSSDWTAFADHLLADLEKWRSELYDEGNAKNALAHAAGHLKRQLPPEEAAKWRQLLHSDWRAGWEALFPLAMQYGDSYLKRSRLFAPDAPAGHVWIRWKKADWLVIKENGEPCVLVSAEEIRPLLPEMTEMELEQSRLIARLGNKTSRLEIYDKLLRGEK